jgi:hypothetical protein
LPGYDGAIKEGYSLGSHSADNSMATYHKDFPHREGSLALRVEKGADGKLIAHVYVMWKMVQIGVSNLGFPHPRLAYFEGLVERCIPKEE